MQTITTHTIVNDKVVASIVTVVPTPIEVVSEVLIGDSKTIKNPEDVKKPKRVKKN